MKKLLSAMFVLVGTVAIAPALTAQPDCVYTAAKYVDGKIKCTEDAGVTCVTCPE